MILELGEKMHGVHLLGSRCGSESSLIDSTVATETVHSASTNTGQDIRTDATPCPFNR